MKGIPVIRLKQLRRTAVITGVGALIAGASVLGATQAHAAAPILGTQPGGVQLSPASGSTTGTVTYSSTACPSGFQGSGELLIVDPATGGPASGQSALAAVNNSVAAPFTGTLISQALNVIGTAVYTDIPGGPEAEMVMACFTGPSATGNESFVQDQWVSLSADSSTYQTFNTPPTQTGPVATTTHLSVSPSSVEVGQTVTLTATVSPANAAGTVQFTVGGSAAGSPVTVTNGTASMTSPPFAAAGTVAVGAAFTPTDATAFGASSDNSGSVTVNPVGTQTGTIPLSVTVPASGAFTLNVDTADTVTLAVSGSSATAATTPVVVTDTRNTYPGWSVSGQANQFVGSNTAAGSFMSGNQLGWMPTSTGTLPQGVTLGGQVNPVTPGLGTTPAVLASVHAGLNNGVGTTTLGANLTLAIPTGQAAGPYAGGLVITAADSNP